MMKICIDSNILIFAFNKISKYFQQAQNIIDELILNEQLCVCDISLIEFFQVITNPQKFEKPLSLEEAKSIVEEILDNKAITVLYLNAPIIKQSFKSITHYQIVKYEIYDHLIATTLKMNDILDFYTTNIKDFQKYEFLNVSNPFNI